MDRFALLRYFTNMVCVKMFWNNNTMIKMELNRIVWKVLGPCEMMAFMTLPMITGRNNAGECLMAKTVRDTAIFFLSGLKILSRVLKGFEFR
jgi:hypothetical protein